MSFLKEFAGHPGYKKLLQEVEQIRPQLPRWKIDPLTGRDNTEEWKQASAMLDGFDNAIQIIFPK